MIWSHAAVSSRLVSRALGLALAAGVLLALAACRDAPPQVSRLAVGQALPEFRVARLDGTLHASTDWRGRALVLNFWATWCAPCREEMPGLQRLSDAFAADQLVVAGISVDQDLNLVREFLLRYGVRFAQFADPAQDVARERLGISVFPLTLLVTPEGRVADIISGRRDWDSPATLALISERLGVAALPAAGR